MTIVCTMGCFVDTLLQYSVVQPSLTEPAYTTMHRYLDDIPSLLQDSMPKSWKCHITTTSKRKSMHSSSPIHLSLPSPPRLAIAPRSPSQTTASPCITKSAKRYYTTTSKLHFPLLYNSLESTIFHQVGTRYWVFCRTTLRTTAQFHSPI